MSERTSRILAIDPGDKNIGVAISDPTRTIASPVEIFRHKSRAKDARHIIDLAQDYGANTIVVGCSIDDHGEPTFQGRKSVRLAAQIRSNSDLQVDLWDESLSTKDAMESARQTGTPVSSRGGHQDDVAAAIILQSYLEALQ